MDGSPHRWMLWTPRVLGLLLCAYLALFALDAFGNGGGLLQTLLAFGMHLVPALALLLVVILSWRWEWVGAVVFMGGALAYAYMARGHLAWIVVIAGPLLLVGLAFLQSWVHHDELHGAT